MTQVLWWMCIFMFPMWIAWFNLIESKIKITVFFLGYSALISWAMEVYFGFDFLGGLLLIWIFAFSGSMGAFFVAKNISR